MARTIHYPALLADNLLAVATYCHSRSRQETKRIENRTSRKLAVFNSRKLEAKWQNDFTQAQDLAMHVLEDGGPANIAAAEMLLRRWYIQDDEAYPLH